MDKKKAVKIKATVKQSAEKITSSEATEKIFNSEAVNKAKSSVNNFTDKVTNTEIGEKAKEILDSAKAKNIKANKIIKIGSVALIIVVLLGIFSNLFGEEKKAIKSYKDSIIATYTSNETRNPKVKVECVAKTKVGNKHYYAFRTEVTWEKLVNIDSLHWEEESSKRVVEVIYNTKTKKCEDNNNTYFEYTKYKDNSYKLAVKNAKDDFKSFKKIHKYYK